MSEKPDERFPYDDATMYANAFGFMSAPLSRAVDDEHVDAVVMGIPYDLATTGRAGARHGPQAIRRASANLVWEERRFPWTYRVADRLKLADYGDVAFSSGDSDSMLAEVERHATRVVAAGKTLLALGGDHFVTLPLLRAHARTYGPLALVHFDAHTDTYAKHERYDHGSMFHHAPREGLIDVDASVQIGIRTDYTREDHGFLVLDAMQVNESSAEEVVGRILERVGDRPAYLSFDIDCLDPAFAPATGTPVAGGISSAKALHVLHGLRELYTVGYDVVEVAPAYDHADVTALAAASLALQFLYMHVARG